MNIIPVLCSSCAGTGQQIKWEATDVDNNIGRAVKGEVVCGACNGKGYTEYATFTVEEAKAILKHCGLSTES